MTISTIIMILVLNYVPVDNIYFLDKTYYPPSKKELKKEILTYAEDMIFDVGYHGSSPRNDCDNKARAYDTLSDMYFTTRMKNSANSVLIGWVVYEPDWSSKPHVINWAITDDRELVFLDQGTQVYLSESEISSISLGIL